MYTHLPTPSLIFMRGEGRCAQATLKVELDCSGDNKPTYSSTATDPVNNSGVALANHCQSVIFYCFCPVHMSSLESLSPLSEVQAQEKLEIFSK